jgi:ribokinase
MPFFKKKPSIDFLAIGDIVTDAFIKIKEAHVNCDKDEGHCELCLAYGDKVPFDFVEVIPAVGNSANAAVSAARLGIISGLVAGIGDDKEGQECLTTLRNENVSTDYITINKGRKTNYHYVLWYEKDRTILVKHESFKYQLPKNQTPKWLYLSSLGNNTEAFHDEIADYVENNPGIKLVFQPGTFQMKMGIDRLNRIYKNSEIFFCNVEEAERILNIASQPNVEKNTHVKNLLDGIHALGSKIVVITDGPNGSYGSDGKEGQKKQFFLPAYPDQKPAYERTGAGDCFASTTTVGIIQGKTLEESMKWGSINSMSVVQEIGAQKGLLTKDKIEGFLKSAPEGWNAQVI